MKLENINRFKEVVFLAAFLCLLFSFSNRALAKAEVSKERTELSYSSYKLETFHSPQQISFNENFSQEFLLLPYSQKSSFDISDLKIDSRIERAKKLKILLNVPAVARFYYHFFSLQNEEDPA